MHLSGPVEPGSWAAINDAIAVPTDTEVVRLYLELKLSVDNTWNWHRTFDLYKGVLNK